MDTAKVEGRLDLDTLRAEAEAGRIDTVLLAMTDMQGRLQGKRLTADHFSKKSPRRTPRAATTCSPLTWTWRRSRATTWLLVRWLRGLRLQARLGHVAGNAVAGGYGARHLRPGLGRRLAGGSFAAPDPAPSVWSGSPNAGWSPSPARSLSSSSSAILTRRRGARRTGTWNPPTTTT